MLLVQNSMLVVSTCWCMCSCTRTTRCQPWGRKCKSIYGGSDTSPSCRWYAHVLVVFPVFVVVGQPVTILRILDRPRQVTLTDVMPFSNFSTTKMFLLTPGSNFSKNTTLLGLTKLVYSNGMLFQTLL